LSFFPTVSASGIDVRLGDIHVRVRGTGSDTSTLGAAIRGDSGVSVSLGNVDVQGGLVAHGVDYYLWDCGPGGTITQSGTVSVSSELAGSQVVGVVFGGGDGYRVSAENVQVTGGALAHAVSTTFQPGTIGATQTALIVRRHRSGASEKGSPPPFC